MMKFLLAFALAISGLLAESFDESFFLITMILWKQGANLNVEMYLKNMAFK